MGGVHNVNMTCGGPVTPPGCIPASLLVPAGMSLWRNKQLSEFNLYFCLNGFRHEIERTSQKL